MKNVSCRVVVFAAAGMSCGIVLADSNQVSTTQPTTQPMLDGKVLSTGTAAPAAMPSGKSPVYTPPAGPTDGGGNKTTGLLINGGIGPTVVPNGGNNTAGVTTPLPANGEAAHLQAATSQPMGR